MQPPKKGAEGLHGLKAKCAALEHENLRLHRKIVKLEAEALSTRNATVARLEATPPEKLTNEELERCVRQILHKETSLKKAAPKGQRKA